jgi:hypothetical protein
VHVVVVVVVLHLRGGCTSSALCSRIGLDVPRCIVCCNGCCPTLFYLNTKHAMHDLKKNRKKDIVVEFLEIKTRETKTFVPKSMFCDQNTLFSNEITAV